MSGLDFRGLDASWWPYAFILLAGALPTQIWRFLGVLIGESLSDESRLVKFMRASATGLVAAVIARYVLYPTGLLAELHVPWRVGTATAGFVAYLGLKRNILCGILVSQCLLFAGAMASGLVKT